MNREQLHELLKKETLKRHGQQSRTNEEEKDKREKDQDTIRIQDPEYLAKHAVFHEIKPGEFLMGEPGKKVKTEITKPFAMMATQVTQLIWAKLKIAMGERDLSKVNPSKFKTGTGSMTVNVEGIDMPMKPGHPLEQVSWDDVKEFIDGLNLLSIAYDVKTQKLLTELIPGHQKGDIYDFPTDAQWEFVMRDRGNANKIYFDRDEETDLANYAWFDKNSGQQTHAVAWHNPRIIDGKQFYDLEGNVMEWTKDSWDGISSLLGGKDPIGTNGSYRVLRGGGWRYGARYLRSGDRAHGDPGGRDYDVGFRLVRTRP
jgi:formylglycine-generating enzyme required for sulfatase activity